MIIDKPGIYDEIYMKGSSKRFALQISSSDVEIYLSNVEEVDKFGVVIMPPGQFEEISNIKINGLGVKHCGGTACFVYHNKGYVKDVTINNLDLEYNGLSYTNAGAHGFSSGSGGQRVYGGGKLGADWDWWKHVHGTEYVMTIGMHTENTKYTEVAVNNNNVLYPRGHLKKGVIEKLEVGEFAVDTTNIKYSVDVHVNLGLTLEEMNSGLIRFKLMTEALSNIILDGSTLNGQYDVHKSRPEAAAYVFDDGVNNSIMRNIVAKNSLGPAVVNNGGHNNIFSNIRSKNCAINGGREFVVNALSENLMFTDCTGEKDKGIMYAKNKGIKNILVNNYRKVNPYVNYPTL